MPNGQGVPRKASASTETLLEETIDALKHATFIGKGDGDKVVQMLLELDWKLESAVELATTNLAETDLTVDPKLINLHTEYHPLDSPVVNQRLCTPTPLTNASSAPILQKASEVLIGGLGKHEKELSA
mmetsp:Transcript_77937/g.154850  ORF Transcript_77937/g.154850 Transcript_77937/m.154850 type:complete len:128 (+) Transcript_77937:3688-4071(+)